MSRGAVGPPRHPNFSPDVYDPPTHVIQAVLKAMKSTKRCFKMGDDRFVKSGVNVSFDEALAMEFIRLNTRIPVPTVRFVFRHENRTYIVMDFVDAQRLDQVQASLSGEQLCSLAVQLKDVFKQLRELGSSDAHPLMGSWPSGPYSNCFFERSPPIQEFHTMEEFRAYWLSRVDPREQAVAPDVPEDIHDRLPVLTHGDLASRNILVKDGQIVAVLDWETFGWYPEFWEYMAAYRGAWHRSWITALKSVFAERSREGFYYAFLIHCATEERF